MSFSIERQIFKGAISAAVRQRCHERLLHTSYVRASEQPESSSRGTLKGGSRKRSLDGIDLEGIDLVGPPDPVSNIRPMIYAPSQKVNRDERKTLPTNTTNSLQNPHPYSAHEFQQSFNNNNRKRIGDKRRIGLGLFTVYRDYLDYVCDRVEESEMKLRIAKLTTDKTTQRFWKDNNNRFTNDMQAWSQQQQQQPKQLNLIEASQKQNSNNQELIVETPSSESDFYATWLKANAKRNKAYNVLVWKQAFEQVRLGFKVNVWRTWLSVLRTLEG